MSSERTSRQRRPSLKASSSSPPPRRRLSAATISRHLRVDDAPARAADAALGRVVEDHLAAARGHVLLAHRRQPVGLVLDRVLLGADAEEAAVEQADRAGQHALARQLVAVEVGLDVVAQGRQRVREAHHVVELLGVAPGAPARRGRGTACGRRRRCRSPAGGRAGPGRSRRPSRRAGCPARGCARGPPDRSIRAALVVAVLEAAAAAAGARCRGPSSRIGAVLSRAAQSSRVPEV